MFFLTRRETSQQRGNLRWLCNVTTPVHTFWRRSESTARPRSRSSGALLLSRWVLLICSASTLRFYRTRPPHRDLRTTWLALNHCTELSAKMRDKEGQIWCQMHKALYMYTRLLTQSSHMRCETHTHKCSHLQLDRIYTGYHRIWWHDYKNN